MDVVRSSSEEETKVYVIHNNFEAVLLTFYQSFLLVITQFYHQAEIDECNPFFVRREN